MKRKPGADEHHRLPPGGLVTVAIEYRSVASEHDVPVQVGGGEEGGKTSHAAGSMRTEQRRFALVVAGMHRSGTGAVARVLSILGCDVPRTLSAADSQDECGHWAAQSVIDLNDAILASAGSAWDDWQAFDPAWYDAPAAAEFRRRA